MVQRVPVNVHHPFNWHDDKDDMDLRAVASKATDCEYEPDEGDLVKIYDAADTYRQRYAHVLSVRPHGMDLVLFAMWSAERSLALVEACAQQERIDYPMMRLQPLEDDLWTLAP